MARRMSALVLAALAGLAGLVAFASPAAAAKPKVKDPVSCAAALGETPDEPKALRGICDYLAGRQGEVQVALFDQTTGRLFSLSNGDATQYTASIVKVDILAKWLRSYQRQDAEIPDDIPFSIQFLMQHMIENSDNAAATSLFYFGGGCDALTRFNKLIPMDETQVACETPKYYGWGNTQTTARDQVDLMRVFAYGDPSGVLSRDARDYGVSLMQSVQPDQRWGLTCGPWGTACDPPNYAQPVPGVSVALKNGWKTLPTCTQPIELCPWQVNSTGWVQGQGENYVLSVLTTRDPVCIGGDQACSDGLFGFRYGIDTIQNVSKLVWDNLS